MKNKSTFAALALPALLFLGGQFSSLAQSTAFTYQGRLNDGAAPANGIYDLRFTIYDSTNLPGTVVAGPLTNATTSVSNGLFTVALDFGAGVFTGPDRWLEIGVRTNGAGAFTTLAARQNITSAPYAISAANLGGALHVETNNTNGAPNIVGGSPQNQVDPGFVGAVISGGGATNYFGTAYSNRVAGDYSVVGGGLGNVNLSGSSVISGGVLNQIQTGGAYSGVASGLFNLIEANTDQSFIGGGYGNSIRSFAGSSVIGGGELNTNGSAYSVIAGGHDNVIESLADSSAIGGGWLNYIQSGADQSVIAGGNAGHILSGARESFIGGGFANTIQTNSINAFIGGGVGNTIGSNASLSTIAGGLNNSIQSSAQYATIGGGQFNSAGFLSTVGGGQFNVISNAFFGTIGGGVGNAIGSSVQYGTIGGGNLNQISQFAHGSTIAGGWSNSIRFNVQMGAMGGGFANVILTGGDYSSIGGGIENSNSGYISVIGGGDNNNIEVLSDRSVIGGGGNNRIKGSQLFPVYGTISGGQFNLTLSNSIYPTIGGGLGNTVQTNAQYATIPGGLSNLVAGAYSFAAGQEAQALHAGAFVWADSQLTPFASTTNDQFSVRAQGGVRFVTGGTGVTVDGQPMLTTGSGTFGLSLQQNSSGAPNVIEGSPYNSVVGGVVGATIGGGGSTNYLGAFSYTNSVTGNFGTVGGGDGNTAGFGSTVAGGSFNAANNSSVVGGGVSNNATGFVSTVGGGLKNLVTGEGGTIGGGEANTNSLDAGTIGGGIRNLTTKFGATVSGGEVNTASGAFAMVGGGYGNTADGVGSFVGGGGFDGGLSPGNVASGAASFIGGGLGNSNSGYADVVVGGFSNTNQGYISTIGGGSLNNVQSSSSYGVIAGGIYNTNNALGGTVGGGGNNTAGAQYSTVAGGYQNSGTGGFSVSSGGYLNSSSGSRATVPGGYLNSAAGDYSFAAGQQAQALHAGSFVWADSQNAVFASTVSNQFNVRAGNGLRVSDGTNGNIVIQPLGAVGAGYQAINFNGYYDQAISTEQRFNTNKTRWRMVVDQRLGSDLMTIDNFSGAGVSTFVAVLTNGNVGIGTTSPTNKLQVSGDASVSGILNFGAQTRQMINLWGGVYGIGVQSYTTYFRTDNSFPGGGFAWYQGGVHNDNQFNAGGGKTLMVLDNLGNLRVTNNVYAAGVQLTSDRNAKENFAAIEPESVLAKVVSLPITRWNFKQDSAIPHIGPMAQDFHAAFNVGPDDTHISVVDEGGVALAAIQGLNQKLEQKETEITELKQRLETLEKIIRSQKSN